MCPCRICRGKKAVAKSTLYEHIGCYGEYSPDCEDLLASTSTSPPNSSEQQLPSTVSLLYHCNMY